VAEAAVTTQTVAMNRQLQVAQVQLKATGVSAAQTANNLRMLGPQITDIAVGLSTGQSPFMVMMQQGGQLKDIFGGIGPAARAVGGYIAGLVSPVTIAAAAVGVLGLAYYQGTQEAHEYAKAIILSGNAAGTTVGQLQEMAKNVSAVVGTQGKAAEVLAMLTATGRVAADQLQSFAQTTVQLDRLGVEAKDTVADLAALGKDPLQASQKLNESLNYLTVSTYKQIKALQDRGQIEAAGEAAQNAYAAAAQERADKLQAQLGMISRGWMGVKDAAAGRGTRC
jgi:phage-related minor tail protein